MNLVHEMFKIHQVPDKFLGTSTSASVADTESFKHS